MDSTAADHTELKTWDELVKLGLIAKLNFGLVLKSVLPYIKF